MLKHFTVRSTNIIGLLLNKTHCQYFLFCTFGSRTFGGFFPLTRGFGGLRFIYINFLLWRYLCGLCLGLFGLWLVNFEGLLTGFIAGGAPLLLREEGATAPSAGN